MINAIGSFVAGATTLVTFVTLLPVAGPIGAITATAQTACIFVGGSMGVIEYVNAQS